MEIKEARHLGYRSLSGIKNDFILKFSQAQARGLKAVFRNFSKQGLSNEDKTGINRGPRIQEFVLCSGAFLSVLRWQELLLSWAGISVNLQSALLRHSQRKPVTLLYL